ncbi:MAG: SpoIIE family protein phosphatase [Nitrososphaeraceae archaeon]
MNWGALNKEETIRLINETNDMLWNMRGAPVNEDHDPVNMGQEAYDYAVGLDYDYGKARAIVNIGMVSFIIGHNAKLAVEQLNQGLDLFKKLNDQKWAANTHLSLGIICNSASNPEAAMYHALRGIDYYENNVDDTIDRVMGYYIIGTVFKDLKKYDEAEAYFLKGIAPGKFENIMWMGRIYNGLSNIYTEQEKFNDAIITGLKGLDVLKAGNNEVGMSRSLNDIGLIYKKQKKYDFALDYFFEALKIREKSNLKQFALSSLIDISSIYKVTGEPGKAIEYLKRAATVADDINLPARLAGIYREIGDVYKSTNEFEKAFEYLEKYMSLTIELHSKERDQKLNNVQDALLQEKLQEIERLRNVELKNAYSLITEKNKEIMDSIHYAKRIQKTLMASDHILNENLGEYFVLYKPKDIVSGDFYWCSQVQSSEFKVQSATPSNLQPSTFELFYLAVCDSTGHGVPGAFMSLLNITFLNEAINEKKISEPNEVFNHVRERLINAVSQDGARDGMDGILICFDKSNSTLTYSAANNGPILKTKNSIRLLSADKMPVGKDEKNATFKLETVSVEPGDILYLITDGYADQFGGPKGKKFKYKQLESLIFEISSLPMKEQEKILDTKFEEWKGNLEQVDDVLIIGIKI